MAVRGERQLARRAVTEPRDCADAHEAIPLIERDRALWDGKGGKGGRRGGRVWGAYGGGRGEGLGGTCHRWAWGARAPRAECLVLLAWLSHEGRRAHAPPRHHTSVACSTTNLIPSPYSSASSAAIVRESSSPPQPSAPSSVISARVGHATRCDRGARACARRREAVARGSGRFRRVGGRIGCAPETVAGARNIGR